MIIGYKLNVFGRGSILQFYKTPLKSLFVLIAKATIAILQHAIIITINNYLLVIYQLMRYPMKHFLKEMDLTKEELLFLIDEGVRFKTLKKPNNHMPTWKV